MAANENISIGFAPMELIVNIADSLRYVFQFLSLIPLFVQHLLLKLPNMAIQRRIFFILGNDFLR